MRAKRVLTYAGVWLAATTAAVTLSWLGVRDVIRGAVFDQPDSVPVVRPAAEPAPPPTTGAPPVTSTPTPTPPPPEPTMPRTTTVERPVAREPAPAPASDGGDVRAYDIMGGQVVLSLHPNYAELISATPSPGYSVRTWEHPDGWLRIEFTAGQHGSSLIVTWHDGPIRVSTQAY